MRKAWLAAATILNHQTYAALHGYAYYRISADELKLFPGGSAICSKAAVVLHHLQHHQWLFWLDIDAAFGASRTSIETRLQSCGVDPGDSIPTEQFDLVLAQDHKGLNAGVFAIRNTSWSQNFLKRLTFRPELQSTFFCERHSLPEGTTLRRMLKETPSDLCHIRFLSVFDRQWQTYSTYTFEQGSACFSLLWQVAHSQDVSQEHCEDLGFTFRLCIEPEKESAFPSVTSAKCWIRERAFTFT
ncbi:hypothetical protein CYMTET_16829 [Cymbomonas tetramitiformis]|uniref:Uncharacterized protein n=1 Tax=Cymbomonas tetramitiformis TaxID=36881 RepID=A0AAE0GBE8_9CHLO|nr:hypothetical protein CYMTET_16829 [Cymbomonas tetramitiformis]